MFEESQRLNTDKNTRKHARHASRMFILRHSSQQSSAVPFLSSAASLGVSGGNHNLGRSVFVVLESYHAAVTGQYPPVGL